MEKWTLYYNPKCGTCRDTLKILRSKGIRADVVEYLKKPLSLKYLDWLVHRLRIQPIELLRAKEPIFEKLKLGDPGKSRKDLLRAICENPILLQRPIVVRGETAAVIARPAEKVLELF